MSRKLMVTGLGSLLVLFLVSVLLQALKLTFRLAIPLLVVLFIVYLFNEIRTGLKD